MLIVPIFSKFFALLSRYTPFLALTLYSIPSVGLNVSNYSWLTPLPNYNFEVQALLKKHNNRVIQRDYNPSAGLLPSSMNHGVGSQLEKFVSDERLGEFTGSLRLKFLPENTTRDQFQQALHDSSNTAPVVVSLSDSSGSVKALASESVREKLCEIVSDANIWDDLSKPDKAFAVTLRSVDWKNERFFVLKGLQ